MTTENKRTVIFEPDHIRVEFTGDKTILEVAAENGMLLDHPCGGNGSCGKCRVTIPDAGHPTMSECSLLRIGEIKRGVRLACQTMAQDGMRIFLGAKSRQAIQSLSFDMTSGVERIAPEVTRDNAETLFGAKPEGGIFGLAVDIGTTTLAVSLVDLEKGTICAALSCRNPQAAHGDDVISRISYAALAEENVSRLQSEVIGAVNKMTVRLAQRENAPLERIFHVIAAGNTTMEHLFTGRSPAALGRAPYTPDCLVFPRLRAQDLELMVHPQAYVDLMPNIAGHVGGDMTAGLYYTRLFLKRNPHFLIDLGINSEMALEDCERIFVCSAAAGPAFEGARIQCGMSALPGAIESAVIRNRCEIQVGTVHNRPVAGICGSGLVDLVVELIEAGVIADSGRFLTENAGNSFQRRLWESVRRGPFGMEIPVFEGEGRNVVLTQRDVREVQLAKGAIQTGTEMLFDAAGLSPGSLGGVYVAGAFGNYLNKKSAQRIDILPAVKPARITAVGNTAGLGCVKALLSADWRQEVDAFLRKTTHIELTAAPDFQDRFVRSMQFREKE